MDESQASTPPLPGARFVDHVGIRVPDPEQAVAFFEDVPGCVLLVRAGPWSGIEVPQPDGSVLVTTRHLAMLRAGPDLNLELLEYAGDAGVERDAGHLAIFVDDPDAAARHDRAQPGVTVLDEPQTVPDGPLAGLRFVNFLFPWGLRLELLCYLPDLPYTRDTADRPYRFDGQWPNT